MKSTTLGLLVAGIVLAAGVVGASGAPADGVSNPTPVLQTGHSGHVERLCFSRDGRLLVTSGSDWTLRLWDVPSRTLLFTWPGSGSQSAYFAFSPDGRRLAAMVGQQGEVIVRDTVTGKAVKTWRLEQQSGSLAWSPDGKLFACAAIQFRVDLCDSSTGRVVRSLRTHSEATSPTLAFSPDSRKLFCGGEDSFTDHPTAEIFDTRTGGQTALLRTSGSPACGAFSPGGGLLAIGCGNWPNRSAVELWDVRSWKRLRIFKSREFALGAVRFDGESRLAALDTAGSGSAWHLPDGKSAGSFGHEAAWRSGALGPGLAAIDEGGGIQLTSTSNGADLGQLPGQTLNLAAVTVTPDGATLVAAGKRTLGSSDAMEAVLWDLRTGQWKGAILWAAGSEVRSDSEPPGIVVSDDGANAAVNELGGSVAILDLRELRLVRRLRTAKAGVGLHSLGFLPAGKIWVAGEDSKLDFNSPASGQMGPGDPIFELWDWAAGTRFQDLSRQAGLTLCAGVDRERRHVLALTDEGKLWSYDVASGKVESSKLAAQPGRACRFSPHSTYLAVEENRAVRLFDLAKRQWEGKPIPNDGLGTIQALSDDGLVALERYPSASGIWDGRNGKRVMALAGVYPVVASAFIPSGDAVALAVPSGAVYIAREGRLEATLTLLPGPAKNQEWITLSATGDYLGSERAQEYLRWRQGSEMLPGNRFVSTLRSPERVQEALIHKTVPEVFREVEKQASQLQRERRAQVERLRPPPPVARLDPATPAEKLKAVLSDWDSDGSYEECVRTKISAVRALVDQGADPNIAGAYGTTPLMLAVSGHDVAFVRELIGRKVDLNRRNVYGATALHEAAEADSPPLAQLLLAAGAELKEPDGKSLLGLSRPELNRALLRATTDEPRRANSEGVFQTEGRATAWLLLYLGADPNTRTASGDSLLNDAFYPWLVAMLLRKGGNPNFVGRSGYPPLVAYAMHGQLEPAEALLAGGGNPDVKSKDGWTALNFAAQGGHLKIVNALLRHGARVNLPSSDGRTALHLAAGRHVEIVRTLLDHGANPNVRDVGGYTTLEQALLGSDPQSVQLLLAHGANARVRTTDGKTMLQVARQQDPAGRFGLAKLILAAASRRPARKR